MSGDDVTNFMPENPSQLSLVFESLEQCGSNKDRTTRQRKRIDGFPVPENVE
jgi:hypothetical protein